MSIKFFQMTSSIRLEYGKAEIANVNEIDPSDIRVERISRGS